MKSPTIQLRVDRYLVAEICSARPIVDVLVQVGPAIQAIPDSRELLAKLLELLFERVPAERGTVLLAGTNSKGMEPAAFRGDPFEPDSKIAAAAFQDLTATLWSAPRSTICVPLWLYDSRLGAIYLESRKPEAFTADHLNLAIAIAWEAALPMRNARQTAGLQAEAEQLREYAGVQHGLVGQSPAMVALRKAIDQVSAVDTTVLIQGEMGTGKELVARAIHNASRRANKPFIAINCAALSRDLIANELFGNERGAFTGALGAPGKIEKADGGTIFLDEIGDLPLELQGMLLRLLEQREFHRVGGTQIIRVDVRVITATNVDLEQAVEDKKFRGDLYHRLAVYPCWTPSLRDTPKDVPALARHLCDTLRHIHVPEGFSKEAMDLLVCYDWPGNIRQLRNAIEYALIARNPGLVLPEHLPVYVLNGSKSKRKRSTLKTNTQEVQKTEIVRVLKKHGWNVTAAARELDMSPRNLWRYIRKFEIQLP